MKKIIIVVLIVILLMVVFMAYTSYQSLVLSRELPKYLAADFPVNKDTENLFLDLKKLSSRVEVDFQKLPLLGESIEVLPPAYQNIVKQKAMEILYQDVLKKINVSEIESWRKFYTSQEAATGKDITFRDVQKIMLLLFIKARELQMKKEFEAATELYMRIIKLGADISKGISLDASILSVSAGSGFISMAADQILKMKKENGWNEQYLKEWKPFLKIVYETRPSFSNIVEKSYLYTKQFIKLVLKRMKLQFKILNFFYGDPQKELEQLYTQVRDILNTQDEKEKLARLEAFSKNYSHLIRHPLIKMVLLDFYKGYTAYQKMLKKIYELAQN